MAAKKSFQLLETIFEFFGGFVIVVSFIGLGVICYFGCSYFIGGMNGIIVGAFGGMLIIFWGIRVAIKAYKGKRTIHFISRVRASPELDYLDSNENEL